MSSAAKTRSPPLYEQVKEDILSRIASGEWPRGARLPSEHELVERFGISRMTVHRALRELSDKGVIERFQGVGSFVAAPTPRSDLVSISDISEEIHKRGNNHRAQVVELGAIRTNIELATTFELNVGARIFHSVVVHFEEDSAIQLEERFVNPTFAPHYLEQDFTQMTPGRYLQDVGAATEVEQILYAALADERAQTLMGVGPDEACLLRMRRTWVDGVAATKSFFVYPGSRYSLGSRYQVPATS
ncbi:histidine utilization repressor [Phenylobacterium sp. SCN 70-31]|uniref:histidine utilization repressor n=1 Tax=Phenylobacterium sp. SCN 70-31 TaxID=1660129 RepID=UPI00086854E7|nr:histidine utilization repressor [Phenylobacterium sp. SCN 70-31]ODT88619.1 MAG: histidine utilization repressor [Phenylobacterium sp. SCN 70-31]